jgi:hypothetical protein
MTNDIQILFRCGLEEENELTVAQSNFHVVKQRNLCQDSLVIGRYSVLPFYKELELDLKINNCQLINNFMQHKWIANFEYYEVLKDLTFPTYFEQDLPYLSDSDGPFVVKGKTNSRKWYWKDLMYASTKRKAIEIGGQLLRDSLISDQGVIYRKYIPLKNIEIGINDLPFSNEWRFFFLGKEFVDYGFYWSIAEKAHKQELSNEGVEFAHYVAEIASQYCNFFVLDIAEKDEGGWILVEINDGQMSGLSMIKVAEFYSNLRRKLKTWNMNK